ncbi:M23 family metallopeptidase [Leptospira sp. GIMC2001]|uniref:M23 family metallopeptidase n=1 Tax=Leptospira sp. GIMC2001 TaxID=1513297 RepID=UPI00234B0DB3|nr:M23 family metallopeptidase [Leptospira sp. GIMC2001]WCL47745.1 M23 family metallopeptidase [Leptospira sp. GIMC2001]
MKTYISILVLFVILISRIYAESIDHPDTIVANVNSKEWEKAKNGLNIYRTNNPEAKWTYATGIWVLENLHEYEEGIDLGKIGSAKWPEDIAIKKANSQILYKKAKSLIEAKTDLAKIYDLFEHSYDLHQRDFVLAEIILNLRERKMYEQALDRIQEGKNKFPNSEYFSNLLPYTSYLHFKEIFETKNSKKIKEYIEKAESNLDRTKNLSNQFYYLRIINLGLRELNDQAYFERIYSTLKSEFTKDPFVYDEYGFQLYGTFRTHNKPDKELKNLAIASRRKAYDMYWKNNQLPNPIQNLNFPLKGNYAIWAEFGGTAMTHNGFANYCYDFAAVDENKNIFKPGSQGDSNSDYYMFGQPIYSVADGVVTNTIDKYEDNIPGGYSAEANTITIDHGKFLSFYAHNKFESTFVKAGDKVQAGQKIALAGNSGMSSQSHLHFCIYSKPQANSESITIPFKFKSTDIIRNSEILKNSDSMYKENDIVIMK